MKRRSWPHKPEVSCEYGSKHLSKKHSKVIRMKSSKSFYEEFDHYNIGYFNSPEEAVTA